MEKKRRDLRIEGVGRYAGGNFDHVNVEGVGKINGTLRCIAFNVEGVGSVAGDITCSAFSGEGVTKVSGGVACDTMRVEGTAKIKGGINGQQLTIEGACKVLGEVQTTCLEVSGAMTIKGDVSAEQLKICGALKVYGDINTEVLESVGRMKFNEIGATRVSIQREERFGRWIPTLFGYGKWNKGYCIEADTIQVEGARISILRGHDVTIGKDCIIDCVEYTGTLVVHPKAKVKVVELIKK